MDKSAVFAKPETDERKTLTKPVLLSWALRFMRCAECDCSLSQGFHDDHIKPLSMGGTNAPDNRQPLCLACHKEKTRAEAERRAKADRISGRKGQYARRKKHGPKLVSNRKLQSRPMNRHYVSNDKVID